MIDPYCDNKALSFFKYKNEGVGVLICNGTRSKLEKEYLAESLRGHIQYFATSYSKCPDHEGRAADVHRALPGDQRVL